MQINDTDDRDPIILLEEAKAAVRGHIIYLSTVIRGEKNNKNSY